MNRIASFTIALAMTLTLGALSMTAACSGQDAQPGQPLPAASHTAEFLPAPLPIPSQPMHCNGCSTLQPVPLTYPAFFAPQVPVVPMAGGPVPTMSAFYVPTAPVTQTVIAEFRPARKLHRRRGTPVIPIMVHPVFWLPY